jgi:hypothetical protein
LRAVNAVGDGTESAAVSTNTTPRGLPISGTITADRFNQERATLNATWTANGATITATAFEYSTASNFSGSTTVAGTGTTDAYANVTGLAANTKYYVKATATNAAGTQTSATIEFTTWGYIETVLTQSSGNRTIQTITPRGGSRINPSIWEVVIFGGGGGNGTYASAGGGGACTTSASVEVTDGSGYVSWTVGGAGATNADGGSTSISGLASAYSAAGGSKGTPNSPSDEVGGGPAVISSSVTGRSGSSGTPYIGGDGYRYNAGKGSNFWAFGGGGGSSAVGSTTTNYAAGGNGGAGNTHYSVEGGAGGGGGTSVDSGGANGSYGAYSTYGRGSLGGMAFGGDPGASTATAGVVRFKYYGPA